MKVITRPSPRISASASRSLGRKGRTRSRAVSSSMLFAPLLSLWSMIPYPRREQKGLAKTLRPVKASGTIDPFTHRNRRRSHGKTTGDSGGKAADCRRHSAPAAPVVRAAGLHSGIHSGLRSAPLLGLVLPGDPGGLHRPEGDQPLRRGTLLPVSYTHLMCIRDRPRRPPSAAGGHRRAGRPHIPLPASL